MYLHHISYGGDILQILKDGYLRPSSKTGVTGLYSNPSKWIYTRISTDIDKQDEDYTFLIDSDVLLHSKFILHTGWKTEDNIRPRDIIDGTTLTKAKLNKILNLFKEQCILLYNSKKIEMNIRKLTTGTSPIHISSHLSNEILIENDIDLHTYLVKCRGDKTVKKYLKENYGITD